MRYYKVSEDFIKRHNLEKLECFPQIVDWTTLESLEQELQDRNIEYDKNDLDMFIKEIHHLQNRAENLVDYLVRCRLCKGVINEKI